MMGALLERWREWMLVHWSRPTHIEIEDTRAERHEVEKRLQNITERLHRLDLELTSLDPPARKGDHE